MSAPEGLLKSELAALYLNNVRIAHITGLSLSFQNELREVVGNTTVRTYIYGRDSWSAQADGLCSFSEGYNFDFLMAMLDQYQSLTIKFLTNSSGSEYMEGTILLESLDLKSVAAGDVVRMNMSFKGNGPLNRVLVEYVLEGTSPQVNADDAGCATAWNETYYISNTNGSYPYLQVGDTIYLDEAKTTALTGYANKYIGIKNRVGTAYQLDAAGEVIATTATICGAQQF